MVAQLGPEHGDSEESWTCKSQFYQPECQKRLESASEGRMAEAPGGEAVLEMSTKCRADAVRFPH